MRRVANVTSSTALVGLTSSLALAPAPSSLAVSRRFETTGGHHSFEPGPVTKAIRRAFVLCTPSTWREMMAKRMERNLKVVEELEKENAWLRRHGSPLHVMGLPEHATLAEVKTRYRDLIFETHPDTSAQFKAKEEAAAAAAGGGGALVAKRAPMESDYEILQAAYKMVLNPNSLYHRNNAAPAVLEDLYELAAYRGTSKTSQVMMFGWATWILGGISAAIVIFIGMRNGWDFMFRLFDPDFYRYMQTREAEEAAQAAAGIEVDKDPKQFASLSVKKVMFPGRFVHGDEEKLD